MDAIGTDGTIKFPVAQISGGTIEHKKAPPESSGGASILLVSKPDLVGYRN